MAPDYDLVWINCDAEIQEHPEYVHTTDWIADFLARKYWHDVSEVEHFALVARKKYQELVPRDRCPECGTGLWRADDDWDYCPYCGSDIPNDINISADTDADVMREYRAETGEDMPPEKQDLIQTAFYVKLWIAKK